MTRSMATKSRKESQCDRCKKWMRKDKIERHQLICIPLDSCIWPGCKEKDRGRNHIDRCKKALWLQCPSCFRMFSWNTKHNPQCCNKGKRTRSSYRCRDELGCYVAEEIDEHGVDANHGRYLDATLRELYVRDVERYLFKNASTKEKRAIKITKHKLKTKAESTQPSQIQQDIRAYVKVSVRKPIRK
jgi:hypothetical protein